MASTKRNPGTTIVKADRRGRLRYTQQYKDEVLAAYETSGMSGPAFAAHCGVKYQTFASWVAKRRREQKSPGGRRRSKREFVLAEFAPSDETGPRAAGAGEVLVELPGGASVRIASENQAAVLAALIRALA